MSFIAKNPLTIPEVESSPPVPKSGTRGLFAGKDGWYEVDSDNNIKRIASVEYVDSEISYLREMLSSISEKLPAKTTIVDLPESSWVPAGDNLYSQVLSLDGITKYSKVDLQPTVEQLAIFHEKDISFVTENINGVVTIYCLGQKPLLDYSIQITITEVLING